MLTNKEAIEILQMYKDEMGQRIDKANALEAKDVYQWQMDGFDMAIDALNQTAWIPVGEKLPEPYESVLVSLIYQDKRFVSIDWVSDEGVWQEYRRSYVTAWKPLPEPYKGGDNND